MTEAPLDMDPPFTERRSAHHWAHELHALSSKAPESLARMRWPTGEGGPGPYRWDFTSPPASRAPARISEHDHG